MSRQGRLVLSYPLTPETPLYGDTTPLALTPVKSLAKGDTCNTYSVRFGNHSGTHIDAPAHFIQNGKSIYEFTLDDLFFSHVTVVPATKGPCELVEVVDIENYAISPDVECILFKTGFSEYRGHPAYREQNPGVHPETIIYIRKNFPELRCIGIDSLSISSFCHRDLGRHAHRVAMEPIAEGSGPLCILEDINLELLRDSEEYTLEIIPWNIMGIDSAPCTVIAYRNA